MNKNTAVGSCEQGNIMVMALIILLVLSVLGTAIISIASMEKRISTFSCNSEKAQQSADAGIEWAIENIYNDLKGKHFSNPPVESELPDPSFLGGNLSENISLNAGANTLNFTLGLVSKSIAGSNMQYIITSNSSFQGSKSRTIKATINYSYEIKSKADGTGSYTICSDSPQNRGIVSYELDSDI